MASFDEREEERMEGKYWWEEEVQDNEKTNERENKIKNEKEKTKERKDERKDMENKTKIEKTKWS